MNTDDIMQVALRMAGMKEVPADSGIYLPGKSISKVLLAIDVGTAEVLLAKSLGCDAVIAHHPIGRAVIDFPAVIERHVGFMVEKGVPKRVAEKAAEALKERVAVGRHPANYNQVVDAARSLGMPLMNIHLPIDQVTRNVLLQKIETLRPKTVRNLIEGLGRMPEFSHAATRIEQFMGEGNAKLGEWVLVFAAGTNGGYPVAKAYFENGVDTVIYLHIDYGELAKLKAECEGNLVVLGHMAGDSIGANLFAAELRKRRVEVVTLGVIR